MDKQTKKTIFFLVLFSLGFLSVLFIQYLRHKVGDYNYPPLTKAVRYPALFIFSFLFLIYWLLLKTQLHFFEVKPRVYLFVCFFLLGIFLCSVLPIFSIDLYEYIARGRILSIYNANPYLHPPIEFPQDPLNKIIYWKYQTMIYGPLWEYLVALISAVTAKSIFFTQFFIKFSILMFHMAAAFFIYGIAKEIKEENPGLPAQSYLFNPFILIMGLIEGHLDLVMISFLAASIFFLYNKRFYISAFLLALSIVTKFLPLILLPFYVLYIYSINRKEKGFLKIVLISLTIMALTAFVFYRPFWVGLKIFSALKIVVTGFDTNTFPYIGYKILSLVMPGVSPVLFRYIFYAIFALDYLICLLYFNKAGDKKKGLINSILAVFALYLLFASFQIGAWYMLWIIAFIPLSNLPFKYYLSGLLSFVSLISFWKRLSFLVIMAIVIYLFMVITKMRRIDVQGAE